jgi:hypothetical protein
MRYYIPNGGGALLKRDVICSVVRGGEKGTYRNSISHFSVPSSLLGSTPCRTTKLYPHISDMSGPRNRATCTEHANLKSTVHSVGRF